MALEIMNLQPIWTSEEVHQGVTLTRKWQQELAMLPKPVIATGLALVRSGHRNYYCSPARRPKLPINRLQLRSGLALEQDPAA